MHEMDLSIFLERYSRAPRHVRLENVLSYSNELKELLISFVLLVYMEVEKLHD